MRRVFLLVASLLPALCCAFYFMNDVPTAGQKILWFISRGAMIASPFIFFHFFSDQLSLGDFFSKCSLKNTSTKTWMESLFLALFMMMAIELTFRSLPEDLRNYGMNQIHKKILGLGFESVEKFWI